MRRLHLLMNMSLSNAKLLKTRTFFFHDVQVSFMNFFFMRRKKKNQDIQVLKI